MTDTPGGTDDRDPEHCSPARRPRPCTRADHAGPRDAARPVDRPLGPRGRGPVGDRRPRRSPAATCSWSIFAEFLGFVVWQLWWIVAVTLPAAGFDLSTGEIFWLISIPSLVGATLRIPYSFLVPKFGGRNWTIISAGLLLAPDDRAGRLRVEPRDAVRRAARRGGARRLRRRQLRQLDVEHHLLLPAEGEGLGARPQRRRRQPRRVGRAVRRADRRSRSAQRRR